MDSVKRHRCGVSGRQRRTRAWLLAICTLIATGVIPALVAPARAATTDITPPPAVSPPGATPFVVNAGPGNQADPHISGSLVSYSDDITGSSQIRYHDVVTGADSLVDSGGAFDVLSDIDGTNIVYTHITQTTRSIRIFDAANPSAGSTELNPTAGSHRAFPAIGGPTVAWIDYGVGNPQGQILVYDRPTARITRLTSDSAAKESPQVSPSGGVVVWTNCSSGVQGCHVWEATKSGTTWTTVQLTSGAEECGGSSFAYRAVDASDAIVVYSCTRGGEQDIFWQPVGGGIENRLVFPGRYPQISADGQLISFEHNTGTISNPVLDVYAYDIPTNQLFQLTSGASQTPSELSDVSVDPAGMVRVVWSTFEVTDLNVRGIAFPEPNDVDSELSVLLAAVQGLGPGSSLADKVTAAKSAFDGGQTANACSSLGAFVDEVQAQSGKSITPAQAQSLVAQVTRIRSGIGC